MAEYKDLSSNCPIDVQSEPVSPGNLPFSASGGEGLGVMPALHGPPCGKPLHWRST
jgi:hypothetical protein